MKCNNLVSICLRTKQACPYCQVDGDCEYTDCKNATIPTWQELFDIYCCAKKPTKSCRSDVWGSFLGLTTALGVDVDSKVIVTDDEIDAAFDKLIEKYSPYTVSDTFTTIKTCTNRESRDIRREYSARAKVTPEIYFPKVQKPTIAPSSLTPEQRVELNQILLLKRASNKESDRQRFIWGWFAWRTGMRPSDICRVKWKCLEVRPNGVIWLNYVPHKTEKATSGKAAGGKIPLDEYLEIKPFIKNPDDYVITRHTEKRPKTGRFRMTDGDYEGYHNNLRVWMTTTMRSLGVKDLKAGYVLRKDCATQITSRKGPVCAAQMIGDNIETMARHYVDFHKVDFEGVA